MIKLLLTLLLILTATAAWGADATLSWDASNGATGYRIFMSTDGRVTWDAGTDVGFVLTYTITVPDDVATDFKVAAYNRNGESITHWHGAWVDPRLMPPGYTIGLRIR